MSKKTLLIIDIQNLMFQEDNVVFKGNVLLQNLNNLISQARFNDTPIYYIQHNSCVGESLENGSDGWKIHSEITPKNEDIIIQKTTPDSFYNTTLDSELKRQGV
jgi:nicotinamidase-related amidase